MNTLITSTAGRLLSRRTMATMTTMSSTSSKREGDISNSFVSLSGGDQPPLPDRYRRLKLDLVTGKHDEVAESWKRLLRQLREENKIIAEKGSSVIPQVEFEDLAKGTVDSKVLDEIRKRGTVVVRGVIPEAEARAYKGDAEAYVKKNPWTKAFPQNDPQVYELYWSPPQVKARAHPAMMTLQKHLMQFLWHADASADISFAQPMAYADRLRIRKPGDANFALGPHMDGGSVERWEPEGYGSVYSEAFRGEWEAYDPWDATQRVDAVYDMHGGLGACSAFRMWQGWLSMSHTAPGEGTLKVNPALQLATAYVMLRPFFRPLNADAAAKGYLDEANWEMLSAEEMNSDLQGATPGHGQELSEALHPHLELKTSMVHVPKIRPGDYVAWHCDTIHAVDTVHNGASDSSVLYIPVCPVTARNAAYAREQRDRFWAGLPGQDFPGGEGESRHEGRPGEDEIQAAGGEAALRAMGLARLMVPEEAGEGERRAVEGMNAVLGFA